MLAMCAWRIPVTVSKVGARGPYIVDPREIRVEV
jgi:hypothetical protein